MKSDIIKLGVYLDIQNEHWRVGELADHKGKIYFEYNPEFAQRGMEISPFKLPVSQKLHVNSSRPELSWTSKGRKIRAKNTYCRLLPNAVFTQALRKKSLSKSLPRCRIGRSSQNNSESTGRWGKKSDKPSKRYVARPT